MKQMEYRIKVLGLASRDVQEQFDFIRRRSHAGAVAWYDAYLTALGRLKVDPLGPGRAPEDQHVEEEIRQFFFKTRRGNRYRILYTIVSNEVRVLRVRGTGQDLLESVDVE